MLEQFEEKFGNAGKALSRLIRPTITAPEDHMFVWGDWSNIEARGLPWLAKDEERLDVFRKIDADPENEPDVYLRAAAGMYHHDPYALLEGHKTKDPEVKALRQKGKIAELALGFSGGGGALQSMAANYGMMFGTEEAADIVSRWRAANEWAEEFWNEVFDAFLSAVKNPDGTMYPAGRVNYQGITMTDGEIWVVCILPNGYPLMYRNVRERKDVTYDEFDPTEVVSVDYKLSFESEKGIKFVWRGLLVENITQAACAAILREALLYLDQPGFDFMPVVAHTHDEIVTLVKIANVEAAKVRLNEVMTIDQGWHDGLPLGVDIVSHSWYSKTVE